jgi:hypothetical protein
VATTLVLHGVAFVSMDAPLQQAYAAIDDAVPDDAAVATVAIRADGGCRAGTGPLIGAQHGRGGGGGGARRDAATYVEVFCCPADLARAREALAGRYTEIRSVEGLAVLRRSP